MARPYREDIDWLRAIAVLAVLGFHWHIPPLYGGYVGVDIFFVVSGFLITQIIQAEAGESSFSFANFYERRIRRLLPALYVMAIIAPLPAFYLFLASERVELFKSIIATVTFTSNIYFWKQSSYFDNAAGEKPMLHTWSLSVEEQFYLVLPIVIWALCRWRTGADPRRMILLAGLGVLGLASFALSHWLVMTERVETAFFLSPPRAWEFLVGSLIATENVPAPKNIHLKRIARLLGVILILIPVIGYRERTVFPGVAALLPCFGAAAFIWSGMGSGSAVRAVWSPLNVAGWFGKISYSLYLWHWPLFVYLKLSTADLTVRPYEKAVLFAVTVVLASASYYFIEQPFRRNGLIVKRKTVFAVAGGSTVMLLLASVIGVIDSGRLREAPSNLLRFYARGVDPQWFRNGTCFVGWWSEFDDKACLTPAAGKANVLVWGDSVAAHNVYGLRVALDPASTNLMQASVGACFPTLAQLSGQRRKCFGMQRDIESFLQNNSPDLVIMGANWNLYLQDMRFEDMIADIRHTISIAKSRHIPLLIVGPPITYRTSLPLALLHAQVAKIDLTLDDLLLPTLFKFNDQMKAEFPSQDGMRFVSLTDAICPQHQCPIVLGNGAPMTFDHVHLTTEGSVLVGGYIAAAAKQMLPALK